MEAWRKDAYRIINQFLRLPTNAIEQPISKVQLLLCSDVLLGLIIAIQVELNTD